MNCGKKTSEKRKKNVQNFDVELLERQLIERERWVRRVILKCVLRMWTRINWPMIRCTGGG